MDSSFQAEGLLGAGRGALITAMFGAGWLGWGLGSARAFNGFIAPTFGFTALFLLFCSIYFIRKGRLLRRHSPAVCASTRQTNLKWFLLVVLMEAFAIVLGRGSVAGAGAGTFAFATGDGAHGSGN